MITRTVEVLGMTCGHCVGFVTDELTGIAGVTDVRVDLSTGSVTVTSDRELTTPDLRTAIEEAGYELGPTGGTAVPSDALPERGGTTVQSDV